MRKGFWNEKGIYFCSVISGIKGEIFDIGVLIKDCTGPVLTHVALVRSFVSIIWYSGLRGNFSLCRISLEMNGFFFFKQVLGKSGIVHENSFGKIQKRIQAKGSQMGSLREWMEVCKTDFADVSRTFCFVLVDSKTHRQRYTRTPIITL